MYLYSAVQEKITKMLTAQFCFQLLYLKVSSLSTSPQPVPVSYSTGYNIQLENSTKMLSCAYSFSYIKYTKTICFN